MDLISPANAPKKESAGKDSEAKKEQAADVKDKKSDVKKPKEAAVSTVVLKIRLHCDGCIQRIKKTISRIKGVQGVSVDSQKDLVTVKGTMDVGNLPPYLKDKLKRNVEIVPQKKEGGGGEQKGKGGDGGGEKKEEKKEKGGGGGGEKKEEKKEKEGEKKEEKKGKEDKGEQKQTTTVVMEANKMEYYYNNNGYGGASAYGAYQMPMPHAPQMFSDENPNACSIM